MKQMPAAKTYRQIYEQAYGPIPPKMIVHHLNFDHNDNRPENFVLLTRNQHNVLHRLIKWLPKQVVGKIGKGLVEYGSNGLP